MNFLKNIILAVYSHYRKNNSSSVAAFHSRVVVSFSLLLYFSVGYILLKEGVKLPLLNSIDLLKSKLTYFLAFAVFYLVIHLLGGSNKDLEMNRDSGSNNIKIGFFVGSAIGLILLFIIVPLIKK
ncbi:hypothetical protein GZH53_09745 [Flavihumibacter sp. R14]|nr:hypothetical protein [Flavihumibacter soli]